MYETHVTPPAAFPRETTFSYLTEEATWWEIDSKGRLDIFIGDMEPLATHLEGTYIAVSRLTVAMEELPSE